MRNRAFTLQQVFVILCQAAEAGQRCPLNDEIGRQIGYQAKTASRYVTFLVEEGSIGMAQANGWRVVTITQNGKTTAHKPVKAEGRVAAKPPVNAILANACTVFGLNRAELVGSSKVRRLFKPRAAIAAVAHECGRNFSEIGRVLNRDPSTILHAYRAASDWQRVDPDFAARLNALRELHRSAAA